MSNTFYTTATITNDNQVTEDKGLYMDGLDHAKENQLARMKKDENIKCVVLLPSDDSDPIFLKREHIPK